MRGVPRGWSSAIATVSANRCAPTAGSTLFGTLAADLRYAARQLLHNPGFALVSILTLAIGIGASTAIFSAVNPILFKPLPYPHADRLMMIQEGRGNGLPRRPTFGTFHGLAEGSRSFDAMAVMKPWQPTMAGTGQPERFEGQRVSADYFRTLGVLPGVGRDFEARDDQFRGPNVVVLSDRLWRRRFAGDDAILGRQVRLDDNLFHRDRRHAGLLRECAGAFGGALGAAAVRSVAARGGQGMGPPSAA